MSRRALGPVIGVALAIGMPAPARSAPRLADAGPGGQPIVIEAYAVERPADADRLLEPVVSELTQSGFLGPDAVAQRIDGGVSRSARPLDDARADDAVAAIERGYKLFLSGKFEGAVKDLEGGLALLRDSPSVVVGKPVRREAMMRALVGLAMSYKRRGRSAEATRTMADLARSFPDREVSYTAYGPEPRALYESVRQDLGRQGVGSVAVDVDDPRTVVFLNERYAGVGDIQIPDLYPGAYRVFLQQGDRFGRVHTVVVEAGGQSSLTVSWQLDASLRTDRVAAMVFDDEGARRDQEARFAVRVARAVGAPAVVVIGVRQNAGRRSVVGSYYTAESTRPLRSGAIAIEPVAPASDRLEALARLLAGDEAAAGLVAPLSDEGPRVGPTGNPSVDRAAEGGRPVRVWKWVGLSAGVAAIGTGAALIALHQEPTVEDSVRTAGRDTRTAGIVAASAGAVLTGVGIYLFVRDGRDRRAERGAESASVYPLEGGGVGFSLSGRF